MKKFKVWAEVISDCYLVVEAETLEEAIEIAENTDGGEFEEDPTGGEFKIGTAYEIESL